MSFLVKLVPKSIQKLLFRTIKEQLRAQRRIVENEIPKVNFLDKHLTNARLLKDRETLLDLLPKSGTVAELGVDEGNFSQKILQHCKPEKLHLVDFWGSQRYNQEKRKSVEARFRDEITSGKIEINIGDSVKVGQNYPDKYFDWIYIDTGHEYDLTAQELIVYHKKVKKGGVIAGHDFTRWNRAGFSRFGVMEAVSEFCNEFNWELIYMSLELNDNPSFAIRKLE